MKLNKYDIILGILILLEIGLCLYIAFPKTNDFLCTPGSGCETVQNSIYGTLFGIKLAWFGVICFSVLFIFFLLARYNKNYYWMFFLATVAGAAFAIYFIYLQIAILESLCRDCIIIDSIMILMFVIAVFEFLDFKKEIKELEKNVEKAVGI